LKAFALLDASLLSIGTDAQLANKDDAKVIIAIFYTLLIPNGLG